MRPARAHSSEGFVLIAVMWVLAILTVLTIGFGRRALLEQRAAVIAADHTSALYQARGEVEETIGNLRNQAFLREMAMRFRGDVTGYTEMTLRNPFEKGATFDPTNPSANDEDKSDYMIADEEGRISLNTSPPELFDDVEGLSFTTASAILRRRGGPFSNDEPNPFLTVEELRYMEGISSRNWQGTDETPGLKDLFTVYGDGRVNINTAPAEVIRAIPDLNTSVADAIIVYRQGLDGLMNTQDDRSFLRIQDIPLRTGVNPNDLGPLSQFCKFESQVFSITGLATRRQGKVRASASAVVQISESEVNVLAWKESGFGS